MNPTSTRQSDPSQLLSSNHGLFPNPSSLESGSNQIRTNRFDGMLDVETYQIIQSSNNPSVQNHATNSIKALTDMFTCKFTNFPITVAMFTQQNNKEYLSKLANELYTINRIENVIPLRFSKILFLFPLVVSAILGYFVGMITNWQVGLSIGHIGMFMQITFLVLIITGSRFCHKTIAIRASHKIAQLLQWIKLFLSVCFCYPTKPVNSKAPVKTIVVYHRLWPNSTTNIALFSLVEKMWSSLIRHYGQILIRLQRSGKPCAQSKQKFKKVCCLPAFLVMIAFWIAFIVSTSIMRFYSGHLAKLLAHGGLLPIFVLMTSIMFLSFFGSLPSLYRVLRGLTINPIKPIQSALAAFLKSEDDGDDEYYSTKSSGKINEAAILSNSASFKNLAISAEEQRACKADMFIKSEFIKVCNLSLTFDKFMSSQQTRFILCLDASECTQKDVLAKIIYQIHNLILSDSSAPVAIVLEANFQVLLGDLASNAICLPHPNIPGGICSNPDFAAQTLSDNYHLVHASIHLPIYIEPPIFMDIDEPSQQSEILANQTNPPPNGYPIQTANQQPSNRLSISTYVPRAMFDNISVTYSHKPSMSKIAPLCSDAIPKNDLAISQNNNGSSGHSNARSTLSSQYIAGLFLNDSELADWNGKVVKQLVFATSFSIRFFKLCNLDVTMEELTIWITLVQHWPYHTAWLVIYLEELSSIIAAKSKDPARFHVPINLTEALREVKNRVAASIDRLGILTSDDRDLEKLNKFLLSKASHTFTVLSLKRLASCTLMHNPFFRICIKAITNTSEPSQSSAPHQLFASSLGTLMEEQNGQTEYHNESSRMNQSSSAGIYASIRNHMGKSESNQGILQASTASLSSMENAQSNHSFPPTMETITIMDPATNKPYFIRLRKRYETKPLSQFTVNDVCDLISCLVDISSNHVQMYQNKIRQHNLNGTILSLCDLDKLRQELMMSFTDWQLFNRLIIYLRSFGQTGTLPAQSNHLGRMQSDDLDESESGSFKHSIIIQNKHTRNQPLIGHLEQVQLEQSAEIPGLRTQSNQVLIRQTPWLMSPQIPITITSKETVEDRNQEISYSDKLSAGSTDQQNSCSGMEEPESLWKVKPTIPTCPPLMPTGLGHKSSGNIKQPYSIQEQSSLANRTHAAQRDLTGEGLAKTGDHQSDECHMQFTHPSTKQHKLGSNAGKPITTSGKHDYTSRSTIDLRTAFGPSSQCTQGEFVNNPSEMKLTKRSRIKKALHDRKWLIPNSQTGEAPFYTPNLFGSGFCLPGSHGLETIYSHLGFEGIDENRLVLDQPLFTGAPDPSKLIEMNRIKKHPRRRFDRRLHIPKSHMNPELSHQHHHHPHPQMNGNSLHGPENCGIDMKITQLVESESDSVRQNQSEMKNPKLNPTASDYYRGCLFPSCGRIIPSPALTPAQLASLQSYAAWSSSLNHLLSTTGIEDANAYWNKYFQITPNPMAFLQASQASKMESRASKPSQKKRPRKCSNVDEFPVDPNEMQPSYGDKLGFEKLIQSQSQQQQLQQQLIDECNYNVDSEMDECTCDYWYELEQNRAKFTLSEPSLRAESEESSTDEYGPGAEAHMDMCRCNK